MAKFTEISVKSYSEETGGDAMTLYESAKKEGVSLYQHQIVRNMIIEGFDDQTIARVTGLTLEEVQLKAKKAS